MLIIFSPLDWYPISEVLRSHSSYESEISLARMNKSWILTAILEFMHHQVEEIVTKSMGKLDILLV